MRYWLRGLEQRSRRLLLAAALVAGLAVGLALGLSARGSSASGSSPLMAQVEKAARQLPSSTAVSSYRLVYRIDTSGGPSSTEEFEVERPFSGRYQERSGTAVLGGALSSPDGKWVWRGNGWTRIGSSAERFPYDQDLRAPLQFAIALGKARVVGAGSILGRPCTIVRTGAPVGASLVAPTPADHDDICVDKTGVELSDSWILDGKLVRAKRAETFQVNPRLPAGTFDPSPAGPAFTPADSFPVTQALAPSNLSKLPYTLDPPAGFRPAGGFLSVPTTGGTVSGPGTSTELFVHGTDIFDMTEGRSQKPLQAAGVPVQVPAGRAALNVQLEGSTLEIVFGDGNFMFLEGQHPADLVLAARGIRARS